MKPEPLMPEASRWASVWLAVACLLGGLVVIGALGLIISGCASDPEFVGCMRDVHDRVAPRHRVYLEQDEALDATPKTRAQRARRLRTLIAWDTAIKAAEEEWEDETE